MWAKELQFVAMKVLSKRSSACSVERICLVALRGCVVQAARARLGPARAVDLAKAGSNLRLKRKLLNLDYEVEMRMRSWTYDPEESDGDDEEEDGEGESEQDGARTLA